MPDSCIHAFPVTGPHWAAYAILPRPSPALAISTPLVMFSFSSPTATVRRLILVFTHLLCYAGKHSHLGKQLRRPTVIAHGDKLAAPCRGGRALAQDVVRKVLIHGRPGARRTTRHAKRSGASCDPGTEGMSCVVNVVVGIMTHIIVHSSWVITQYDWMMVATFIGPASEASARLGSRKIGLRARRCGRVDAGALAPGSRGPSLIAAAEGHETAALDSHLSLSILRGLLWGLAASSALRETMSWCCLFGMLLRVLGSSLFGCFGLPCQCTECSSVCARKMPLIFTAQGGGGAARQVSACDD